jgi:acyl-CoA-binding protein
MMIMMRSTAGVANQRLMAVAVTASVVALSVWFLLRQRQQQREQQSATTRTGRGIDSPHRADHDEKLWRSFEDAAAAIQSVRNLSNGDKLILYGLYKQVVVGDAPDRMPARLAGGGVKTPWTVMTEQAKFAAWNDVRGMAPSTALQHYVNAVTEFTKRSESPTAEDMSDDEEEGEEGSSSSSSYHNNNNNGDYYGLGPGFAAVSRPVDLQYDAPYVSDGSLASQLLDNATDFAALQKLILSSPSSSSSSSVPCDQASGLDINHADGSGQTALHLAADAGALDCVLVLVAAGANVHAADRDGISVLQAAVIAGHADTVQYLLQQGADPDQADGDGDTPRSCAVDAPIRRLFHS